MLKLKKIVIVSAIFLVVTGCGKKETNISTQQKREEIKTPVKVATVARDDFSIFEHFYGKTRGCKNATILCYAGGHVDAVYTKEGEFVRKGTHLASIDGSIAANALRLAKLNKKIAEDQLNRVKENLADGNASKLDEDRAELALINNNRELLNALKMYKGAMAIAPFSGIVTGRYIEPYSEVAPGSPVFSISDISSVEVSVFVPEYYLEYLKKGDKVSVSFMQTGNSKYEGRITRISREVNSHTRGINVIVSFKNKKKKILPGMSADVLINVKDLDNVISIPEKSIMLNGDEKYVIIAENDIAHKRVIQTSDISNGFAVVTSGLKEGETVVVEGQMLLSDGTSIKILN